MTNSNFSSMKNVNSLVRVRNTLIMLGSIPKNQVQPIFTKNPIV
jgi:hypothetical protein